MFEAKKHYFLILFILPCLTIAGQNKAWTLKACIDTGIQRNLNIRLERVANGINAVNLNQSKDNLYPELNLTDAPGFSFGKTQNANGDYVSQNTSSNSIALTAGITLYDRSGYRNTIHQNEYIYQAGAQSIEKTKNDISLNILTAYMVVLANYEGVNIAETQLQTTQAQVNQTKIFVDAGRLTELNLLQVESQLANDKLAKVNAENQLKLAKVNLMQLMNIPIDYNFEIVKPLNIDSLLNLTSVASGDIYNTASGFLPQIKNAQLTTQATESGVRVAKALYYPKLTMSGILRSSGNSLAYNTNYGLGTIGFLNINPGETVTGYIPQTTSSNNFSNIWNQLSDNFNQFIGFNLTIPIFNGFMAKNSVEIAKLNMQNSQLNEDAVKLSLRQTIEQAYTNLLNAAEQYSASKEALQAEERTFNNIEKKFQVGLENATNYFIEKSIYTKAEQNVAQSKYNYLLQIKLVDFYLGKPITF